MECCKNKFFLEKVWPCIEKETNEFRGKKAFKSYRCHINGHPSNLNWKHRNIRHYWSLCSLRKTRRIPMGHMHSFNSHWGRDKRWSMSSLMRGLSGGRCYKFEIKLSSHILLVGKEFHILSKMQGTYQSRPKMINRESCMGHQRMIPMSWIVWMVPS